MTLEEALVLAESQQWTIATEAEREEMVNILGKAARRMQSAEEFILPLRSPGVEIARDVEVSGEPHKRVRTALSYEDRAHPRFYVPWGSD